ncbi:MAG: 50S ribosomal protein L15 [Chloroflexi bacterium RBG_13_52_14]|jgi:large subunit ribosomal protein L15|nr:MAG: 50S ribosomal protein L15 [Chloroflexi bacterium RBG_13_52_14]
MKQNELSPSPGSKHKRKRIGRGDGSGHGTYSCRGLKGQKSRSGPGIALRFEGGQTPLVKRLPGRRGFTNIFKTEYAVVNLQRLNIFGQDTEVTPQKLVEVGIVPSLKKPIKILGNGELQCPLVVKANKFSQVAKTKIEAAGGRAEEI